MPVHGWFIFVIGGVILWQRLRLLGRGRFFIAEVRHDADVFLLQVFLSVVILCTCPLVIVVGKCSSMSP